MNQLDGIINKVIGIEGGYVDDARDSGGATRWGITEAVAREHGYVGEMRDLPVEQARLIYRQSYANPMLVPDMLRLALVRTAHEAFEGAVNLGVRRAAKNLQRVLNVLNRGGGLYGDLAVDGRPGPNTRRAMGALTAADRHADRFLSGGMNVLQGAFYIELCERREKDEKFFRGWIGARVFDWEAS